MDTGNHPHLRFLDLNVVHRHLINWALLSGFANDKAMTYTAMEGASISMALFRETLLPENYQELYNGLVFFDFLENNGLQISSDGRFISRGYGSGFWLCQSGNHFSFAWAESLSWRETLEEFLQRKLIENGLTQEDVILIHQH